MSDRDITAVVLLSGTTTPATLESMLAAIAAQTHAPDRVLALVPSTADDAVLDLLDDHLVSGRLAELVTTSSAVGHAGAVRELLELPGRASPEDHDPGLGEQPAGTTSPGRRRAAGVDHEEVERRRTSEAEQLARIPMRLRTARRSGRRAGRDTTGDEPWLWFLMDGSPPAAEALSSQLEIITRSPTTAVVGAKRVRRPVADQERALDAPGTGGALALVDVGLTLTHNGRIITGVDPGEIDQGQSDWRQDVLAVALPGMLIREQTLRDCGGLDPDLPAPWAEIDLCHQVWRRGERVAVQAAARVLFPNPTRPRLERLQEQRTGQLLVLLKHRPALLAGLMLLLSPLTTVLRMIAAVAATTPRRALVELRAWWGALRRAPRVIRRGVHDRRGARVPEGRLAPLYLPRGEGIRRTVEDLGVRMFAMDDRERRIRRTTWGIAGTHHGADDADFGRHSMWTVTVAITATLLSLIALRGLFGRGALSGPALLALPQNRRDAWEAAWSSWVPGDLGARGPLDAFTRLLGHLPVLSGTLIEVLVFGAIPSAALTAWWASGALTRAIGARLVLTVTWALAPPLLAALGAGAWPLLVIHVLLPLLALAVGRAIGLPHKISRASVAAAAAGGLLLLVIGAIQPVLVLLTALGLLLLVPAVPGRRLRLLWVLLPSMALHAPYLPLYLGEPAMLLAVSGVDASPGTVDAEQLLRLWPSQTGAATALTDLLGIDPASGPWLLALPLAPVVVGALCGPLLAGAAGRAGRLGILLAAGALLALGVARQTPVLIVDGAASVAPLHGLLSLLLLALGIGAGASFDALARRERVDSRSRRWVTSGIGGAVALVCVAGIAGWSVLLPGTLEIQRTESGTVPAAAADQGRTEARSRVLVLERAEDGAVEISVIVHGGDSALQHAAIESARQVDVLASGAPLDADPGSSALRAAVSTLLTSGADAEVESASDPEADQTAAATLASSLAVGYIVVPGAPEENPELVAALDASTDLEKVTSTATGGLWRVIDASPRARVDGGAETTALSSTAIAARGEVPVEDVQRTVILAERFDSQWAATVDGARLEPVLVDGWAQGFVLPAGTGGEVIVDRDQPLTLLWQIVLGATLVLTVLIAIPWRPRTRRAEELYG